MTENEKVLEQSVEQDVEQVAELPEEQEINPKPLVEAPDINPEHVALDVAQDAKGGREEIVTLSTGYRVQFLPVSQNAIAAAQMKIKDPKPPLQDSPSGSGAKVPNKSHPDYLQALDDTELKRANAIQDVLFIFGLELVDPLPESDLWLEKLVLVGLVDEQESKEVTQLQKELWYKKYMVADVQVFSRLAKNIGVTEEGIAQAGAAFKSNTE